MIITYLFKNGRKNRLDSKRSIPSEFFYGYKELLREGFNVNLLEEKDLNFIVKNYLLQKLLNFLAKIFFNLPLTSIFGLLNNKNLKKLNKSDCIIATTNSLGIAICCVKKLGLIRPNILFINMGLFSKKPSFLKLYLYKYLFRNIKLITISKTEYKIFHSLFSQSDVRYISFGIDNSFWYPQAKEKSKNYILAIGNDLARDWVTLINSWDKDFPTLKIITSMRIKSSKKNIDIINGNWHSQVLSDEQIRDLYRNSEFVIVPLKETYQPSGQSTCLQAMSCSKAVIISNIKGIWDRNLLKHEENVFFVKPGSVKDLNQAIRLYLDDKNLRKKIEINGIKLIKDNFNTNYMKNDLKMILEE